MNKIIYNTIYCLASSNNIQILECRDLNNNVIYTCNVLGKRVPSESIKLAAQVGNSCRNGTVLDIGTGTGILLLELYKKYHIQDCVGVEINRNKYNLAMQNMKINNIGDTVKLFWGSYEELDDKRLKNVSKIICNPPLIPGEEGFWAKMDGKFPRPIYECLLKWIKNRFCISRCNISIFCMFLII